MLVWHNGTILDEGEARVSPLSAGLLYGWGVFTTLGVRGGKVRAFAEHWQRLTTHAARLRVPVLAAPDDVETGLAAVVERQGVADGRARITAVRAAAGVWQPARGGAADLFVTAASVPQREAKAVALTVSPYRVLSSSPLAGLKATAYVGQLLALEEARARGFDDAVMLNERGEVTEATAANLFWARGGQLFTPSLATGCLAGVTRRLVLEAARGRRLRVTEGSFALAELRAAEEVFLTNSTHGIVLAGELDMHRFGGGSAAVALAAGLEKLLGG